MGIYMYTFVTRSFGLPQLTFLAFLMPYVLACVGMAIALSVLIYRRAMCSPQA